MNAFYLNTFAYLYVISNMLLILGVLGKIICYYYLVNVYCIICVYDPVPCTGTNMPTIILEMLLQYFSEFLATTVVFN